MSNSANVSSEEVPSEEVPSGEVPSGEVCSGEASPARVSLAAEEASAVRVAPDSLASRGRVLGDFVTEEILEILSRPNGIRQLGGRGVYPWWRRGGCARPGQVPGALNPDHAWWHEAGWALVRGRGRGRGRVWSLPEIVNQYFSEEVPRSNFEDAD